MSDSNYYSDRRVRALDRWYTDLDTRRMVATIKVIDEGQEGEVTWTVEGDEFVLHWEACN